MRLRFATAAPCLPSAVRVLAGMLAIDFLRREAACAFFTTFTGASGVHDITVRYFDENDGQATFTLRVGGIVVGSWTANVDDHTWKSRTFTAINIASGAEIRVEAAREEGEHARIDFIEIR